MALGMWTVSIVDFILIFSKPYNWLCYVFPAVLGLLLLLCITGTELGVRRLYAGFLLKVFEYGRVKIERAHRRRLIAEDDSIENFTKLNSSDVKNGLTTSVITRDGVPIGPEPPIIDIPKKEFHMSDIMLFVRSGVEAIIEDEVTKRFAAEELPSWNLLTRTNRNYTFISVKLTVVWCLGCLLRYMILLPSRVALTFIGVGWMLVATGLVGCFPESRLKRFLYWHASLTSFRILSRAFSGIISYHNRENMAKPGGICVANHTSPIDVAVLASDNCYALVGQSQGGFLGVLQRALNRAASHIWFERAETRDRQTVAKRLREHVQDLNKLPILIFPEGTCINNTSVMQFKKGSFEVGGKIYPCAIKYDPKFGDPFWNSSKQNYVHYLLMMMSSWAIVCDVWYLPPMEREEAESAVDFANRVKAVIAKQGGLVDLMWDGQLKRSAVKQEWKAQQQKEYSQRLKFE